MISLDPQITHAAAHEMAERMGFRITLKKGEVGHYVITPRAAGDDAKTQQPGDESCQ